MLCERNTDSINVDTLDVGSGPNVVLVHSSVSGNRQWRRLIESLRTRYRVVAPNLLGYGSTTPWANQAPPELDDAVYPVLSVCRNLSGSIRMVGHSWGAAIALRAASVLRNRVTELVLYEPMITGLALHSLSEEARAEAAELTQDIAIFAQTKDWMGMARRFTNYFNGDGAWEATPPDRQAAIVASVPPIVHDSALSSQMTEMALFAGVQARTLLLAGSQSRAVMLEVARILRNANPNWQYEEIAGWEHMAPITRAGEFIGRVEQFLS